MKTPVLSIVVLSYALAILPGVLRAADLIVNGSGRLIVNSRITLNDGDLIVRPNGVVDFPMPGTIKANRIEVLDRGVFTGCGTIDGMLVNSGSIVSNCGPSGVLAINGTVTNNGTLRVGAGTRLTAEGEFVNNGFLDLTTAGVTTFSKLINNGTLWDLTMVQGPSISLFGPDVILTIDSELAQFYQLEQSHSLLPASWTPIGRAQAGTNGVLTFTHPDGAIGPGGYYRFRLTE